MRLASNSMRTLFAKRAKAEAFAPKEFPGFGPYAISRGLNS